MRWSIGGQPFLTPRGKLVEAISQAIESTTGMRPSLSTTGGTSDGRFIASICPEVIEFGPVNATLHKINENILIADMDPLAKCYQGVLEQLLI